MREIGDEFEEYVLKHLGKGFSKTANSGAKFGDADIKHRKLIVECKVKSETPGMVAPIAELRKLWKEADKQGKDWLYIVKNKDNKVMVLLDFQAFIELSEGWRNKHGDE